MKAHLPFLKGLSWTVLMLTVFSSFVFSSEIPDGNKPSGSVIIGTATTTNHNTPVYLWYGYSFTQTLYFQSELNFSNKIIEEIGYQYAGSNTNLEVDIEIYLEHTNLTQLNSTVQLTNATKVYDGPYVLKAGESWAKVTITPFFYNNVDNLLLTIIEKRPGWNSYSDHFYSTAVPTGNTWCRGAWNDWSPYDPTNLPATSAISFRANTQLWFSDVPVGPPVSQITPTYLNFGDVEISQSKTLQVEIKNVGADPLVISGFVTSDPQFQVVNTTFPIILGMSQKRMVPIRFTPTAGGIQNATIEFILDNGEGDKNVTVTGKGLFFNYIIIGTDNTPNYNTPMYLWYGYSFTQTLYFASEMIPSPPKSRVGTIISRIGYQYAGTNPNLKTDIEIWLQHTTMTSITSSVPLTTATKVFDGEITLVAGQQYSSVEIEPFLYNGTDNLLVTVIEKRPGWNSYYDQFYSTAVPAGQNLCVGYWDDYVPMNPSSLPSGYTIDYRANIKMWVTAELPTAPEARTTPSSLFFGEVETSLSKIMNVDVSNVGGGVLEITGYNTTNPHFTIVNATFPISLPMGQKYTFDVKFAPSVPGPEQGVITFEMDPSIPGSKTVEVSGIGLRFGILREGFEGTLFPPLGWKVIDNNQDNKGWIRNTDYVPTGQTAPRTGVAAAGLIPYAGNWNQVAYDDWLITPKMVYQTGDIFSFWIKRLTNQSGQIWRIKMLVPSKNLNDFVEIDVITDPAMAYTQRSYDLSNYGLTHGTEFYMAFHFNGYWSWPGVIDDILGSVVVRYNNDLMTLKFEGPEILHQNVPKNYTFQFANYGYNNITGSQYSLQICAMVGGVETVLASMPGLNIQSGEVKTVTIPLSISQPGVYNIYGKILFTNDEDLSNNTTSSIKIDVVPQSFVIKNIGDFPITVQTYYNYLYPINFEDYRRTSLSQTLYFKNELQTGGIIDRIGYYRSFGQDMLERKIKVWMAEVNVNDLSGSYIPPSQMTLVFDGNVNFPAGAGRSDIILNKPFVYTGSGNLLVTVYYYWGITYAANARFAYTSPEYGPERTLWDYGWQQINPESPTYITRAISYPNTTLMFNTGQGLGSLSGYVFYQTSKGPVQNAEIIIENPAFPGFVAKIYTNAQGYFSAPYAMAGNNLKVTIKKYGYVDIVLQNINLPAGGSIFLGNLYMMASPIVSLSGTVIKSDTQTAAQGALVKISGPDTYQTTTNDQGIFVFPAIWGMANYNLEITLPGYQKYQAQIYVPGTNLTLDPITLLELAPSPNLVTVAEIGDYAVLNWYGSGEPYPFEFRYDDGNIVGILITSGNPNILIGSAFRHKAIVQAVHWYSYYYDTYPSSAYALVYILGLTPAGVPDPNNVLFVQGNVRNDNGWNTFTLPAPVYAPNGFYFGIAGYNNYIVIGYDDGVGAPYEWQPNRQFSNGMGAFYPLENVTSPPLYANIFIRASGLTYGSLDTSTGEPLSIVSMIEPLPESPVHQTVTINPIAAGDPGYQVQYHPENPNRPLLHYNIYRKLVGENQWIKINNAPVTQTTFTDYKWAILPLGLYHYAVEAEFTNGVFSPKALSNEILKSSYNGQLVPLKQGWSAISTYQLLSDPALTEIFKFQIQDQSLVILIGKNGFFWPGQNINLLGNWDTYQGYKLKMTQSDALLMKGTMVQNRTVQLSQGTNYLPVLSDVPVSAQLIFQQIADKLLFAFDIYSGAIYWPQGGIYTLNVLEPGNSYLVRLIAPGSVVFPVSMKSNETNQPLVVENAPWQTVSTGSVHLVAIEQTALQQLQPGDIIAAFNHQNMCTGLVQYSGQNGNIPLIVYGDDITTTNTDGMTEGEPITLVIYRAASASLESVEPVWNSGMPNTGLFTENGLSSVTGFKFATGSGINLSGEKVRVFPNPASGTIYVQTGNNQSKLIEIIHPAGQVMLSKETSSSFEALDVSGLTPGVYLVRISDEHSVTTQKVVIK